MVRANPEDVSCASSRIRLSQPTCLTLWTTQVKVAADLGQSKG